VPMLVQVCIAIATLAIVAGSIVLIQVLGQLKRTAAQAERTLTTLDSAIPTIILTVDEARVVLGTLNSVADKAERIAGDFQLVGGKAAQFSSLFVDRVATPAGTAMAVISGLRTGASILLDGWRNRRRAQASSHGGNHHE
jgi:hypothetical protein